MKPNDHARRSRDYLEDLCDRMDRGEAPARGNWASLRFPALVPVVLGLSLGCGASNVQLPLYAAPPPDEERGRGICEKSDGTVDCSSSACAEYPGCQGELYAAPPDEPCGSGEDGAGRTDCGESESGDPPGGMIMLYGAPPP